MKFLSALLLALFTLTAHAVELPTQKMRATPMQAPPFDATGGFLTPVAGMMIAAGSNGGPMTLWTMPQSSGSKTWVNSEVSAPTYAAAAKWGEKWIIVGGLVDGKPSSAVSVLEMSGTKPTFSPLLNLPQPLVGAGAAVIGGKLYVFGGATSIEPLALSSDLIVLDLSAPTSWSQGPEFPGQPIAFFAATEQYGMLNVFGGVNDRLSLLSETWVYRPVPLEGTKDSGWQRLSDLPEPSARGAALPIGQAQVVIIGGERGASQTELLKPSTDSPEHTRPLLFHTLTDAWCAFDVIPGINLPVAARLNAKLFVMGRTEDGLNAALELEVERTVRNLSWPDYGVLIAYFLILAGIGWYCSKGQESSEEFALGNRKVKWWAAGISMFATGASAISFMAIPALAFATNLVWLFPLLIFIPAYFVTAYLIFPLLRRMELTSTYEYLERRFNVTLRLIASLQCILFLTLAKTSVVLVLPALAISSVTGMNVFFSLILMGLITTIYTAIGGFDAVIWTEVFQAVLMLFVPVFIIILAISKLPGGTGEFVTTSLAYSKFDFALVTWDVAVPAFWMLMLMQFVTVTVSVAGDQPIIQRVFSAPLKEVRKVNMVSTTCGIVIGILVNFMGLAIFAYFHANPGQFDANAQNDQIVPMFVAQAMPIGMAGLVVAAIFAASMSTVASVMNSVATVFTEDFYMRARPSATDAQRLFCLKASSYCVGVLGTVMGLVLAAQDLKSMMVVWSQLGALLGGGIVGVYTLGMFTKRANGFGAIGGAIISILVTLLVKLYTPIHWAAYAPIAILSCIAAGYVLSLVAPQRKNLAGLTVFTPVTK